MANALPRGVCAGASDPQAEPAPAAASAQASMDFPGGRVPFTPELKFVGGHFSADTPPMSCYRTVDSAGDALEEVLPFQYPASQSCSYGNTPRS